MNDTARIPAYEIYMTRLAQRDPLYRTWLSELNYASRMLVGANMYADPAKLRRWFLAGLPAYDALRKLHGCKP